MPRFPKPALAVALALTVVGFHPLPVSAELPPWVYGEQQRQAPLVVQLRVLEAERAGSEARVRARVLRVARQPRNTALKPGQAIRLRYGLPPEGAPVRPGPSSLPLPRVGEALTAWLQPLNGSRDTFAPAAGGRSFGPSLETFQQP